MTHTSFLSMARVVATTEIRQVMRDGRLRLLAALVLSLTFAALVFGVQQAQRAGEAREHAAEEAAEQWQGQGDKNPHVAAHYGTHLFAPTNVVTAVDPGVSAYLGRSIKVEAHRRNFANHTAAMDGTGLQRMGTFSVASVLLLLVPLLIIVLGYGAWSRERERGTLRQLLSTGVNPRALLVGKATGLAALVAGLLVPAALLVVGALWAVGGGDADTLARVGVLAGLYFVYFGVFAGFSLAVSAWAGTSRAALVVLVALWGWFCLFTPRAASEGAAVVAPLPSKAAFSADVDGALAHGLDGKTPREKGVEALTEKMMKEQGLEATGMLVAASEIAGVELQAEARWEDTVFDHHMTALNDQIEAQERAVQWAGVVSPFVAMRALSSAICGTDFTHHRHFAERAEAWRKQLVTLLNEAFAKNGGTDGWSYKAGPELWKKVPPFTYTAPTLPAVLAQQARNLGILAAWWLVSLALAWWASRKVRVV